MDEVRNWILAIAGIVTIIKHIYDICKRKAKNIARKRKSAPAGQARSADTSETRGEIPLLIHYITSTIV
ncbi:hypothetical protein [Bacillus stercoris]|uniref:hypothetical protein n=1 Tax=Bacillus stercoris TaxID=2054641 RepID=UPI003CF923F1